MGLKGVAYFLTGSVGLLSDAIESLVNLVGALMALWMLTVAAREPDEEHAYGHTKAEYFSSGVEGSLILVAAISIGDGCGRVGCWRRGPSSSSGSGLAVSVTASLVNLVVARVLLRAGRRFESVTLAASAHHLLTDVWTSAGVLVGVGAVAADRLAALSIRSSPCSWPRNIVWTGGRIVRESVLGLLDTALPVDGTRRRAQRRRTAPARAASSITRCARGSQARAGSCRCTCWCPGRGRVHRGHELLERLEREIRQVVPNVTVFTHLEALEDPSSWDDQALDRTATAGEESVED